MKNNTSSKLVLLRHGQSEWNKENRFTGWHDSPLSENGIIEAQKAGALLVKNQLLPQVIHTSVLARAIQTAKTALAEMMAQEASGDIPIHQYWQLNERHYGDLTGLNKEQAGKDFGEEQVFAWRRKYNVRPPEITEDNPFAEGIQKNHSDLENLPKTECLADVLERLLPYWNSTLTPELEKNEIVLVAAHGNSLRALIKYLDKISDEEIPELNIPTGVPLVFELDQNHQPTDNIPIEERYL